MANVQHNTMTGADLHEPKGVGAASVNTAYIADGAGSGTWQKITADEIDTSSINNFNKVILNVHFDDLSAVGSHFIVSPLAGDIEKIYCVLDSAIATADTTISCEIGGVAVTNGNIVIAFSGSAAGDVDVATPTGNKTVTAGQAIEFISDGATNTSGAHAHLTIILDVA